MEIARSSETGAGSNEAGRRGLDWLNLLLAGMGGAYGAFIPVYLTTHAWTQTRIGVLLTVGTVVSILCQVPAGVLVDAFPRYRNRMLAGAIAATGILPLILAVHPHPLTLTLSVALQAAASSLLTPAIAAISLVIAGRAALGERMGRNGRYGSIGAASGAVLLGVCGAWFPDWTIFVVSAALTAPALLALHAVHAANVPAARPTSENEGNLMAALALLKDRRLAVFAACVVLYQTSAIAILQLAAVEITGRLGPRAGWVIAACLILPQLVVAGFSPWLGRAADRVGRRPLMLAGFATLPVRGALFALLRNPYALVPVQTLEGTGGSIFGVLLPLVSADLTRGKGHYTLCLSLLGLAGGMGTAISTALAGWVADGFGRTAAYWVLASAGLAAFALVAVAMPETRQPDGHASTPPR